VTRRQQYEAAENLVVKVAKRRRRRRYCLEDLINAITDENRHPEIEWGPPVGNEV
jgi:antitoxin MazE